MTYRLWFHALEMAGHGPDWWLTAHFDPAQAAVLAETARALTPAGFVVQPVRRAPCPVHGHVCDYDLYVDEANAATLFAQVAGRHMGNVYVFHTLQVCRNVVQVVRGYGGYPGQYGPAETDWLWQLAHTSALTLHGWQVAYGGMTYPEVTAASGYGLADWQTYLAVTP